MPISTAQIKNELLPGLFDVRGKYERIPRQWDKALAIKQSNMAVERSTQMAFLPLPQLKAEGGTTPFDNNAGERWSWNFKHFIVVLGYSMTREAIDDNLYKAQFGPTNLGLMDVFMQFEEIQAASIFNTATTVMPGLGGDGQPLASVSHPIAGPTGGTWANTSSTPLDLNEASLSSSMTAVRTNFVDERGLKILARARQLIVPPQLEQVAIRLLKSELRPGTANNDVNALLTLSGGLPEGHLVMDYLTSSFAWFLKTNIEGLIFMNRKPFEMDLWVDNSTDNLLCKGYQRYSVGYNDPRCLFCQLPTS